MKKIIPVLIIASSCAFASFGQVGVGYSKGSADSGYITGFGSIRMIGNINLQLEYTKNTSTDDLFSTSDVSRYGLFATYNFPLTKTLSITPKIGLTKTDGKFEVRETLEKVTDSSTKFSYGVDANFRFSDVASIYAGYVDYGNALDIANIDTSKLDNKNFTFGVKLDL